VFHNGGLEKGGEKNDMTGTYTFEKDRKITFSGPTGVR
jgi:hypothetical protein